MIFSFRKKTSLFAPIGLLHTGVTRYLLFLQPCVGEGSSDFPLPTQGREKPLHVKPQTLYYVKQKSARVTNFVPALAGAPLKIILLSNFQLHQNYATA